ncbi:FAD:protein FMN transferase [Neisseria musculi]|nr:FAD:protein FMN transferase [Neisseria musculi]
MLCHTKKSILRLLGLLVTLGVLSACGGAPATATASGETMGTTYTVKYLADSKEPLPDPQQIQAGCNKILQEINRQMSTYLADSEISRFNRLKAGEGMSVSADFAAVVQEALRLHALTEGGLDVTIGPLVNLWGFGPDKSVIRAPTAQQISTAKQQVGIDKIRLETNRPSENSAYLSKQADGGYLDLSAIAKGFAVDKLAQYLDNAGIENYLVEIGGELRARGRNQNNKAWSVGIEQPQFARQQAAQIIVPLNNRSLATSGDYRNFRTDAAGKRLSHIIDPESKQPVRHHLASVSVVADNAVTADGLATGLFVLGEEKALAIAEKNRWAVFLIIKTADGFKTEMSPAFKEIVK